MLSIDAPLLANLHIYLMYIGLYLCIGALSVLTLSLLATNYNKVVSNSWSISQESIYATIFLAIIVVITYNVSTEGLVEPVYVYCLGITIFFATSLGAKLFVDYNYKAIQKLDIQLIYLVKDCINNNTTITIRIWVYLGMDYFKRRRRPYLTFRLIMYIDMDSSLYITCQDGLVLFLFKPVGLV
jgi:hypothetical protein